MKFIRKSTLKKHYNKHSKVKPYVCNFPNCNKTFIEKGNLKTHLRVHVYYFLIKKKDKLTIQHIQFSIQTDVSEIKKSYLKLQNSHLKIQHEVQIEIDKKISSTSIHGRESTDLLQIGEKFRNSFKILDEKIEKFSYMIVQTSSYNNQKNHLINMRNYLCILKEKLFSIYLFTNQATSIVFNYNFELENSFSEVVKIFDRFVSKINNLV